jgi:hypothetical protein
MKKLFVPAIVALIIILALAPVFAAGDPGDAAYEAAYAGVFEKVRDRVRADAYYVSGGTSSPTNDISEVSYTFHDIDKNGVKELIFTTGDSAGILYTYSDGAALALACRYGSRDRFDGINELGYMHGSGSSSAYSGAANYLRIADDGRSSVVVALIEYEVSEEDGNTVLYNVMTPDRTGFMTDAELSKLFDEIDAPDIELGNWKTLTDQSGKAKAPASGWPEIKPSRPAAPTAPGSLKAVSTASKIVVDGIETPFSAYLIDGNNYFKLRDLALVLNYTDAQFEVAWDDGANAISLICGAPYTSVGFELTGQAGSGVKTPVRTASRILVNGVETAFTAYNIDGYNYFKLRDVGAAVNFGVDWYEDENTIAINTVRGC